MCSSFYLQCSSPRDLSGPFASFRFLIKSSFLREAYPDLALQKYLPFHPRVHLMPLPTPSHFLFEWNLTQNPTYKTQHIKYTADVFWLTTEWGLDMAENAPVHPLLDMQGTPPKALHCNVFICLLEKRKGGGNPWMFFRLSKPGNSVDSDVILMKDLWKVECTHQGRFLTFLPRMKNRNYIIVPSVSTGPYPHLCIMVPITLHCINLVMCLFCPLDCDLLKDRKSVLSISCICSVQLGAWHILGHQ